MSLAAVFVALAVGLLLGVTIGDTELLSNVRGDLERSLSEDLDEANQKASDLKKRAEQQNEFAQAAYPQMVADRLNGRRVALIGSAGGTSGVLEPLAGSVEPAGGSVQYSAELVAEPRYGDLAASLGVDGVIDGAEPTPKQTEKLGVAVGRRLARGRNLPQIRRFAFRRLSGDLGRVRLFAFSRKEPADPKTDPGRRLDAFERGVVTGLAAVAQRVVGVETSPNDPSSIKWYNSLGLSSVDNIEQYAGHYSFVMVLDGAKGDYGFKDTADAVVPPVAP